MPSAGTVLKLSLAAGALLAGAGIGYYFGVFLPAQAIHETEDAGAFRRQQASDRSAEIERARLAEAQQREAAEREAARQRYQACVGAADSTYSARWASACRAQHTAQQAAYDDCADDWFSTRAGCARKHPVEPAHGCALPLSVSNRLVSDRDAARSQCLGEMQGGTTPAAALSATAR